MKIDSVLFHLFTVEKKDTMWLLINCDNYIYIYIYNIVNEAYTQSYLLH